MRRLDAIQAELDQVKAQLSKIPATDTLLLADLTQRSRELSAELSEERRGTMPAVPAGA